MTSSDTITFLLNGAAVTLSDVRPDTTLLHWLRAEQRLTGSKEGCAEGDCGACTVILRNPHDDYDKGRAVNACILLMGMVAGSAITTIEGVSGPNGALHPVQQAMITHHGAQCGFCTPGFVMSLYAHWRQGRPFTMAEIDGCLAGNLCRCTGYRPIIDAALSLADWPVPAWEQERQQTEDAFCEERAAAQVSLTLQAQGQRFFAPKSLTECAELIATHPQAQIVAGATDLGLWLTKQHREFDSFISLKSVQELRRVSIDEEGVLIGAAVTHAEAMQAFDTSLPDLAEVWRRFGSSQVRSSGTVVGNVANGSPIGDISPCLIALGAEVILRRGTEQRRLPISSFFLSYGKQDRKDGEFLEALFIPHKDDEALFIARKLSKRFDQDISAVLMAAYLTKEGGIIASLRLAFGGMAEIPKRAMATEAYLQGRNITDVTSEGLTQALASDFTPLSDMRASAEYRLAASANMVMRALQQDDEGHYGLAHHQPQEEGRL